MKKYILSMVLFLVASISYSETKSAQFSQNDGNVAEWLQNNVRYPREAEESQQEGSVLLELTIYENGKVSAKVKRSSDDVFTKEALRLVSIMPEWTPASENGKAKAQKVLVPIHFHF